MKMGVPGTPGEAMRIRVKAFLRSDAFRHRRRRLSLKQPPPTQLIQHDPVGSTRPGMRRLSMASTAGLNPHSPDNALSFGAACAIQI